MRHVFFSSFPPVLVFEMVANIGCSLRWFPDCILIGFQSPTNIEMSLHVQNWFQITKAILHCFQVWPHEDLVQRGTKFILLLLYILSMIDVSLHTIISLFANVPCVQSNF